MFNQAKTNWMSSENEATLSLIRQSSIPQYGPGHERRCLKSQDLKRQVTLIEQFLLDRTYKKDTETISADKFFKEFQEFETANTARADFNSAKFGRDVMDIALLVPGLTLTKKRITSGVVYSISKS